MRRLLVAAMPHTAAQTLLDAAVPFGRCNYWKSSFLRELHDDAAEALVGYSHLMTSPYSLWLIEHVHGAPTRVAPDATAVAMRDERFHFVAIASWDTTDAESTHVDWARAFWRAMQPWAAGRVYMNILGHGESDRVPEAYGTNYERLARVKATFDPSKRVQGQPERSARGNQCCVMEEALSYQLSVSRAPTLQAAGVIQTPERGGTG